jgi:hypothetical protein
MDMNMHDRLTRGRPYIDTHVETVRTEFRGQTPLHPEEKIHYRCQFRARQVEEVCNMSSGNDKRVALGNRKRIRDGYCLLILVQHTPCFQQTEWAIGFRRVAHRILEALLPDDR